MLEIMKSVQTEVHRPVMVQSSLTLPPQLIFFMKLLLVKVGGFELILIEKNRHGYNILYEGYCYIILLLLLINDRIVLMTDDQGRNS